MKRIVAVMLTFVMICATFCACGGNSTEETTAAATEAVTTAVPERTFPAVPSEDELKSEMEKLIDTKLYSFTVDTPQSSSFTLKKNTSATINAHITLDGKALPVPYSYQDITDIGFTLQGNKNDILAPREKFDVIYNYSYAPCTFTNSNSQAISVNLCNTTDKEAAICDGAMGKNLSLDISVSPDFNVCGIAKGNTVKDAIAKVGNPYEVVCSYTEDTRTISVRYHFQDTKTSSSLLIYSDIDGNIKSLSFDCNKDYE